MNIRPLESLTKEGLIELNASVRDELESLRLQLAEANKTIERREVVIKLLERDIEQIGAGGVSLMGDAKDAEIARLRMQLEWTASYARDALKTNSKDMDDWRGDMEHIANSARAALSGESNAKT